MCFLEDTLSKVFVLGVDRMTVKKKLSGGMVTTWARATGRVRNQESA